MVASTVTTGQEPLPIGNWVDPNTGQITPQIRNYLEGRRRKTGEVISGISILEQAITVTETLLTDLNGILSAAYAVTVDVNGRVAGLKLLSDGTTSVASINADTIYFGPQTVFDTATETFITEVGSIRSRYGTAFGASSNLIRWDGPTSVAQNSETPTNGYLAIKTDGTIYHNAAALDWGATAAQSAAENVQVAAGANSLVDTKFRSVTSFWQGGKTSSGSASLSVLSYASGIRILQNVGSGFTANDQIYVRALSSSNVLSVQAGDRVGGRALIGGIALSNIKLRLLWYNSSSAYLSATNGTIYSTSIPTGAGETDQFIEGEVVGDAPTGAAFAVLDCLGVVSSASPRIRWAYPTLAKIPAGQTVPPPLSLGMDGAAGADVTANNTASAISGQGVFALGNFYEQASAPTGTIADGSFWAQTGSGDLYIRATTWKRVANIGGDLSISLSPDSYSGGSPSSTITGTATGGSGVYSTYAWTKVSGDTMTLSGASSASTTFSSATSKAATYRLTVTDSLGATAFQDIGITIIIV